MTRKRKLRPEEREIWNQVAASATPLVPKKRIEEHAKGPAFADEREPEVPPAFQPPNFRVGQRAQHKPGKHDIAPSVASSLASARVDMDKKAFARLKRGKLQPEARLDLHGMTLSQAHPALINFVLRSSSEGKRLILIITGKGKQSSDCGPIPQRVGVLKHQVPQWLRMAPLSGAVLQISESHVRHGGAGAYYVYLRRMR